MTSTPAPSHSVPYLRAIAAILITCCIALGITASPFSTAKAHADSGCAAQLQCLSFKSLSNGRQLDVQNGNMDDGAYIVTNSAPGYHESWHLNVNPSDSSFSIVNNDTGKCIDLAVLVPALRQQSCGGQASQNWYFQPVAGATDAFMIRHQGDNTCLDLLLGAQYDDAWTDQYACNGTANQEWSTGAPEAALNLAVDHGAKQCQQDPSSCSWAEKSEAAAAPLPKQCVSSVWFNNTSSTVAQVFGVQQMSGWSNTIGVDMGTQLTAGTPAKVGVLQGMIKEDLTASHIWNGSTTVNNSVTVTVPQQQYGWVTLSELAKKVTGTWTFDARGIPWTADDTITVPLADDPSGGATIYVANTSPTFTSCS
ncbi:RICIN domain-containing protein [Kitasatospora sp. NPDC008050]|uniref:RICIN domain-containing protein n=1 Tax=Kitasatospora sp. NPDC008050 TaxID=3364021 RepID=UPI0036E21C8D